MKNKNGEVNFARSLLTVLFVIACAIAFIFGFLIALIVIMS
jgi:hypothetical protein